MADAEIIATIHALAWEQTYRGLLPDEIVDARIQPNVARWREQLGEHNGGFALLALDEPDAVGFTRVAPYDDATSARLPPHDRHLHALYVLAVGQRRGTGRALMAAAAHAMLADGVRSLSLDVLATNPACAFYERLGAQMIGERRITDRGHTWNQRLYAWDDVSLLLSPAPT